MDFPSDADDSVKAAAAVLTAGVDVQHDVLHSLNRHPPATTKRSAHTKINLYVARKLNYILLWVYLGSLNSNFFLFYARISFLRLCAVENRNVSG